MKTRQDLLDLIADVIYYSDDTGELSEEILDGIKHEAVVIPRNATEEMKGVIEDVVRDNVVWVEDSWDCYWDIDKDLVQKILSAMISLSPY